MKHARSRRRALRAARAVTLTGVVLGTAACGTSDAGTGDPDATSDTQVADGGTDATTGDTGTDATEDTAPDVSTVDTAPDAVADVGQDPSTDPGQDPTVDTGPDTNEEVVELECETEGDGVCPEHCTDFNDRDCCEQFGGFFDPGFGCGIEGPFVPPAFIV